MATLRNPIPDLAQPERYNLELRRDSCGLITVTARLSGSSQRYTSVPQKLDPLHKALSACVNLFWGQADRAAHDIAAMDHVELREIELLPSDIARLKLEPAPSFPHTVNSAPVDDEDLTEEMAAVLDRARASLARGKSISHDEILREFEGD